jgi:hypothetical protein
MATERPMPKGVEEVKAAKGEVKEKKDTKKDKE